MTPVVHRQTETDGIGATLMKVVCAGCKKDMGGRVCEPSQAHLVSHGLCATCSERALAALVYPPQDHGGAPGRHSLFLPGRGRCLPEAAVGQDLRRFKPVENEAASLPVPSPESSPSGVTGTADSAGVMNLPQVVEHARACPAASFTFNEAVPCASPGFVEFIDKLISDVEQAVAIPAHPAKNVTPKRLGGGRLST